MSDSSSRWLEYMRTHPCPYKNGDELRARRREFVRQGGTGDAGRPKPTDDEEVAEWNRIYAEAQKKRANAKPPPTAADLMDLLEQE